MSALKSPSLQCQIQIISVMANRRMLPVLWFMTLPNDSVVRFKVNLTLSLFSDRISVGFLAMFQTPCTSEMLCSIFLSSTVTLNMNYYTIRWEKGGKT